MREKTGSPKLPATVAAAQWDGLDGVGEQEKERGRAPRRHKVFMAALDTLIAHLGFEYGASDGKTYDGAATLVSWSDSHANGDNGFDPTPGIVVNAFREAARLARHHPEQYECPW